ncbi:filamentous hemagglutinin family N-terminal domain [Xenococcus sp. PCC 7305]|uniref:two-partner secretion domain-containing protein n=1 Tax=Xenococcus sp. PCC 7305 TaxID=102125 RepID=UPI0002ABB436|nr:filamentous hemagglutinin N-terminal domain-containing protein [Xenococcus sp. PCC 7305]ELS04518.1 filamentous hemagglutinin family N-terminal domain [Xenococcus sp. PCC 7305]
MTRRLSLLLSLSCFTIGQGILLKPSTAQVSPDGTTNTTVGVTGNDFTIEQGDRAGGNLFHSFSDFSVPTDGSAFFNNAADIVNIFSRVTGGNISNIDGLLGANGGANLFLLNPAGIIFGEGARLDIGGSFFGSTADSIVFPDGEFSATNLANPPLLTINAPIGLSFRDNPGDIVNRSDLRETTTINQGTDSERTVVTRIGLQVEPGNNITLVGGNIFLDDSGLTAPGGIINLGGLSAAGDIGINPDGSLTFPDGITRSDIALTNNADVNVSAGGGGSINVDTRSLTISERSKLIAGIAENSGFPGAQAGDITVNATEAVRIFGVNQGTAFPGFESEITNSVGVNSRFRDSSDTSSNGLGNAGNIVVNTNVLEVYNAGKLVSIVNPQAEGDSGDILVNANTILLDDGDILSITVRVKGNVGDVTLNGAESVSIINGGLLTAQSIGDTEGNSGNIKIETKSFNLQGRSLIIADKQSGIGNAGTITINATESAAIEGLDEDPSETFPQIITQLQGDAIGSAGNIVISAPNISLANFALVSANATQSSIGEPGTVTLNGESISITKGAIVDVLSETNFDGGDININADSLELSDGGKIVAGNDESANAGNINLNLTGDLIVENGNPPGDSPFNEQILQDLTFETGIFANNASGSTGNGGNISIVADLIIFEEQGSISTGTFSGNGGDININTDFIIAIPNKNSDIIANAISGNGGNINITAEALFGIEERSSTPPNQTNDIDASSEFGLDGNVSVVTPDINRLQTDIELPNSLVESEQTVAQACQSDRSSGEASGLIVKGKGGVPSVPTDAFNSDNILIEEQNTYENLQARNPEIKPIKTGMGDIYPARGIIKTADNKIILTAYTTDKINSRTPHVSPNCS